VALSRALEPARSAEPRREAALSKSETTACAWMRACAAFSSSACAAMRTAEGAGETAAGLPATTG
jgi:hypothetical protein